MLNYAAPMHVVIRPAFEPAVAEEITAELNRANELIEKHKKESDVVIDLMRRLNDVDVDEKNRDTIESHLSHEFQTVLLQHGVREGVATGVAKMCAFTVAAAAAATAAVTG